MTETILEHYVNELKTQFDDTGWDNMLKTFLASYHLKDIVKALASEVEDKKLFTPKLKDVFKAFKECHFEKTKVVIIGQDPYPHLGAADGMAFSCSNKDKLETSLRLILQSINKSVYKGKEISTDPNLTRWANQGVLLLNTSLTTQINKIGAHYEIWNFFTQFVFDVLNKKLNDVVFICLGKKAQAYAKYVTNPTHKVLFASHPASVAYKGLKEWDSENVFVDTNLHLKSLKKEEIAW